MGWLDLIVLTLYLQAFIWYGRLSYVQGVLDRHYAPHCERVRRVLHSDQAGFRPRSSIAEATQRTSR